MTKINDNNNEYSNEYNNKHNNENISNDSKYNNNEFFLGTVRNLSSKGLGVIEHPDGRVFFVKGVWPGDYGEFKIDSFKKRYGHASIVKLLNPSTERIPDQVSCPFQGTIIGKCGGCPWMIAKYQFQLKYKQHRVIHSLIRFKLISNEQDANIFVKPIWPSENQFNYRNRMQLKTDGFQIGLVSSESNILAPINDCIILNEHNKNILSKLINQLPNNSWKPTPPYKWNFIEIDDNLKSLDEIKLNKRRPFLQGNNQQNSKMQKWLTNILNELFDHNSLVKFDLTNTFVVELFAGSGNFTEVLSNFGLKNIFAFEVQGDAITAGKNKQLNGVKHIESDLYLKNIWKKISSEYPEIKEAKLLQEYHNLF